MKTVSRTVLLLVCVAAGGSAFSQSPQAAGQAAPEAPAAWGKPASTPNDTLIRPARYLSPVRAGSQERYGSREQ